MTQPAQSSGHEWVSIGEGMYGYCSCDTNYIKQVMTRPMWQAHVASVAQAAQPASAAKPAEDGLEAQLDKLIAHTLDIHWADELPIEAAIALRDELAAFRPRLPSCARAGAAREAGGGDNLLDRCAKYLVMAGIVTQKDSMNPMEALLWELRALLASHWPAQKERP